MIGFEFKPWRKIRAYKDPNAITRLLHDTVNTAESKFKGGMKGYPPASSPGQYPAIRTGRLRGSIRKRVALAEAEIGSNMFYSIFLRMGTRKMARRKMSDDALKEGSKIARSRMRPFAKFKVG
ncbi:MAG: hypothetical protein ACRCYS_17050 [Beijerinckiaceae bacterium]